MRIAVSAKESSLDTTVDPRFGRCPYFLIVETDDSSFEAIENQNAALGGGAGIQSAQLMAEKGVKVVLTGNCGPNAYQTLSAAGIQVVVGCSGSIKEVIESFNAGAYSAADQPSVASHFGTGAAPGSSPAEVTGVRQQPTVPGAGMGMGGGGGRGMGGGGGRGMGGGGRGMGGGGGRGMGGGGGRGMGRGGGMGQGRQTDVGPGCGPPPPAPQPSQSAGPDDELAMLKEQAEAVSRQMQQIQQRISQLDDGNSP